MRKLSQSFLDALSSGFLSGIRQAVIIDKDLDLEIRENYVNIYFKGNSLLNLKEVNSEYYRVLINPRILGDRTIPDLHDPTSTGIFIQAIPYLKENIIRYGKSSLEIEYEQMIIRANNREPRNNAEYFILDRQYATGKARFDLSGFIWRRMGRKRRQEVSLCFMEIKFALNRDIADIAGQIDRYYQIIKANPELIASEAETLLQQKLELGLFGLDPNRLDAMKTLTISRDINHYQFILVLVDYNPYSQLFDSQKLAALPFAKQIKVFCGGFALWEKELVSISQTSKNLQKDLA